MELSAFSLELQVKLKEYMCKLKDSYILMNNDNSVKICIWL